jgi:hypothetical protein
MLSFLQWTAKSVPSDGIHLTGDLIDPARKLVDIGKRSSCAVDGYLGPKERDIADALREWSAVHPTINAAEGFTDLLAVAKAAWDEHNYTYPQILAKKRRVAACYLLGLRSISSSR